jgi:iron complex outermembrane recepter protein
MSRPAAIRREPSAVQLCHHALALHSLRMVDLKPSAPSSAASSRRVNGRLLAFRSLLTCGCLMLAAVSAADNGSQPAPQELRRLSLEELMNIDVTLTARRAEPLATTPAAVAVLTAEEIRRSGVTTIADAVGLIDGVHAARFNNGTWSITARGFNAVAANKMLVMIDGRTVYSPLFSGVFWNAIDYTLEDIERIEVVRGPGATLWGANAVNGVVNIVTRRAHDTTGTYLQVGSGNEDPAAAEVRYGGRVGGSAYRVYGKYAVRGAQVLSDGSSANDRRRRQQVGFRIDRGTGDATLMLKGDLFASSDRFPDRPEGDFTTADVQARWTRPFSNRSALQVQSYVNHEYRRIPLQLTHRLTTFDADVQHELATERHAAVWGGGVRVNHDSTRGSPVLSFEPASRTYAVLNTFVQDDFAIVPGRLFVTPGVKAERNPFSGFELQPGVRARLVLPRQQMLWGSVARAIRRPTRFEDDLVVSAPSGIVLVRGTGDFEPERLIATEVGYRIRPTTTFSAEMTAFVHHYDRLRSQDAPASGPPVPLTIGNSLNGTSHGVEIAATIQPADWWRAHLSYVGQRVSITRDPGSRDISGGTAESNDPPHQFAARGSFDLPRRLQFDVRFRSVASLPNPQVPRFSELGLRLGWTPIPLLELALTGDDLLHARHPEFNPTARGFEEFERSVRVTAALRVR